MKWSMLWRAVQSARAGRIGDAAALKGAATGGRAYPELNAKQLFTLPLAEARTHLGIVLE